MAKNKILLWLKNLFFPPKCIFCKELLQKDIFDLCNLPLCDKCLEKWEYEKLSRCPDCGLELTVCRCTSRLLKKAGVTHGIKLSPYKSGVKSVGKSAVFYMKHRQADRVYEYFSYQMYQAMRKKLLEFLPCDTVITYVPRSDKSVERYGCDQAQRLALGIAEYGNLRCIKLFERTGSRDVEQKKQSYEKRLNAASERFVLVQNAEKKLLGISCVFLVDDVVTSGASMAGCALALKTVYDGEIVAVSVVRTEKSKKIIK